MRSNSHTGTPVTVRVPLADAREADTATKMLVLIVDDDDDIRNGVAFLLQKRGYTTATACNGQDALQQLRGGLRPDMILLDYSMPIMNGEGFCDACADDEALSKIPVIIMSADVALAVKLAQKHASRFMAKPVPIDRLIEALERVS